MNDKPTIDELLGRDPDSTAPTTSVRLGGVLSEPVEHREREGKRVTEQAKRIQVGDRVRWKDHGKVYREKVYVVKRISERFAHIACGKERHDMVKVDNLAPADPPSDSREVAPNPPSVAAGPSIEDMVRAIKAVFAALPDDWSDRSIDRLDAAIATLRAIDQSIKDNAALIASTERCQALIEAALNAGKALEADNARLREALAKYADNSNWSECNGSCWWHYYGVSLDIEELPWQLAADALAERGKDPD